jgi:hypothetical protein
LIERSKKIFRTFPLAESSLENIEKVLFENTFKNFIDPEFPPHDDSISRYFLVKFYDFIYYRGPHKVEIKEVTHWRRP